MASPKTEESRMPRDPENWPGRRVRVGFPCTSGPRSFYFIYSPLLDYTGHENYLAYISNMPFSNITNDFKKVLHERESTTPEMKRAKVIKHTRNEDDTLALHKTYVAEAYNIVCLVIMILCIRLTHVSFIVEPHKHTQRNACQYSGSLPKCRLSHLVPFTPNLSNYRFR